MIIYISFEFFLLLQNVYGGSFYDAQIGYLQTIHNI